MLDNQAGRHLTPSVQTDVARARTGTGTLTRAARSARATHHLLNNLETLDRLRVVKLVRSGADRRDGHLALLVPAEDLVVKARGVLEDTADDGVALRAHEALGGRGDDLDGVRVDVSHCVGVCTVK